MHKQSADSLVPPYHDADVWRDEAERGGGGALVQVIEASEANAIQSSMQLLLCMGTSMMSTLGGLKPRAVVVANRVWMTGMTEASRI